ncbi:MAG: hypothetical protein KJ077_04710 [Anaerolineae bacterium]|nr:hypothetical protein [Anaerolineae bacterium]
MYKITFVITTVLLSAVFIAACGASQEIKDMAIEEAKLNCQKAGTDCREFKITQTGNREFPKRASDPGQIQEMWCVEISNLRKSGDNWVEDINLVSIMRVYDKWYPRIDTMPTDATERKQKWNHCTTGK